MTAKEDHCKVRRNRRTIIFWVFAAFSVWFPAIVSATGVPVAVFPFQQYSEGTRNDINLPSTVELVKRLKDSGNKILDLETVIAYMANNRIRTVGYLETFYIYKTLNDLGVKFLLLGTVTQLKENPEATVGMSLNLVRTSDARTVWSYVGSSSISDELKPLKIGQPRSISELQSLLLDEIVGQWPWQIINEAQQGSSIKVDTTQLRPGYASFGDEIHSRVRLRHNWSGEQKPRIFFKAEDKLYPARKLADGKTIEATWVVGNLNGNFPVNLVFEWPVYSRTETILLGNYIVDGIPPVIDLKLRNVWITPDEKPAFSDRLVILPDLIVREPLSRWQLTFTHEGSLTETKKTGVGRLPQEIFWDGMDWPGPGNYNLLLEVWDKAGNIASSSKDVVFLGKTTQEPVALTLDRSERKFSLDLKNKGKVPLSYWRLEMWTREGKLITSSEGEKLPAKIPIELPDSFEKEKIAGFLIYKDVFGRRAEQKIDNLIPEVIKQPEKEEIPKSVVSESWVEEF